MNNEAGFVKTTSTKPASRTPSEPCKVSTKHDRKVHHSVYHIYAQRIDPEASSDGSEKDGEDE